MRNKDILLIILIIAVVVVISITFKNSVRDLKNYIVSEIPILKDKVDDMIEERVEEELEEREKERKSDIMNKLAEYKDTIKEKLFGYKNDLDKTIDEKINEKIKEYKSENDDDNDEKVHDCPVLIGMLKSNNIKSGIGVAIYDHDNNILGIVIAEFTDIKDSLDEIENTIIT